MAQGSARNPGHPAAEEVKLYLRDLEQRLRRRELPQFFGEEPFDGAGLQLPGLDDLREEVLLRAKLTEEGHLIYFRPRAIAVTSQM